MNYPDGHPTGVVRSEGTMECPGCDETLAVEQDYERATGAATVFIEGEERDDCPHCDADLSGALDRIEWE